MRSLAAMQVSGVPQAGAMRALPLAASYDPLLDLTLPPGWTRDMAAKKAPAAPAKAAPKLAAKALARGKAPAAPAPPPAPPSAPDAKAPAPPTVTLKQLAAQLAEAHAMPRKQAETVMADVVGLVVEHLKAGNRLRIGGLGILEVKHRPARSGRNPATGAPIQIAASKKVAFRAAKELKEAV